MRTPDLLNRETPPSQKEPRRVEFCHGLARRKMDTKGRISLPPAIRNKAKVQFPRTEKITPFVNLDFQTKGEGCVLLVPTSSLESVEVVFPKNLLPFSPIGVDTMGRVLIPQDARDFVDDGNSEKIFVGKGPYCLLISEKTFRETPSALTAMELPQDTVRQLIKRPAGTVAGSANELLRAVETACPEIARFMEGGRESARVELNITVGGVAVKGTITVTRQAVNETVPETGVIPTGSA